MLDTSSTLCQPKLRSEPIFFTNSFVHQVWPGIDFSFPPNNLLQISHGHCQVTVTTAKYKSFVKWEFGCWFVSVGSEATLPAVCRCKCNPYVQSADVNRFLLLCTLQHGNGVCILDVSPLTFPPFLLTLISSVRKTKTTSASHTVLSHQAHALGDTFPCVIVQLFFTYSRGVRHYSWKCSRKEGNDTVWGGTAICILLQMQKYCCLVCRKVRKKYFCGLCLLICIAGSSPYFWLGQLFFFFLQIVFAFADCRKQGHSPEAILGKPLTDGMEQIWASLSV